MPSVPRPLAFVDVETTGLSPSENRVAEIGVVTVDGNRVERWTTLLRGRGPRELDSAIAWRPVDEHAGAPSFVDIAPGLARRLSGHLFVAHNARFDHAFLCAEFERAGIAFQPQVVCSVMLSRKLYPELEHHNLDALADCHRLTVEERHRALPDAELVWQWWQVMRREFPRRTIDGAIASLLAGPVLPPQLDPAVIDQLPPLPGAYVLRGEGGRPLIVGAAGNLKLHVRNYFRVDRATTRALEYAHRVTQVTWRATRGIVGARLHAAELDALVGDRPARRSNLPLLTWRLVPEAMPCLALVPLADVANQAADSYGLFPTERKARNAIARVAAEHRLCRRLLGLEVDSQAAGPGCAAKTLSQLDEPILRKRELLRIFEALRPLRVPAWPHRGAVGLRERSDLHVVDRWRFMGTARSDHDLHGLLEGRPPEFNPRLYRLLRRTMSALPPDKIVDLAARVRPAAAR